MRLGITTIGPDLDDQVSGAINNGKFLLVIDTETMEYSADPYPGAGSPRGQMPHTPQHMSDLGVEVLVTGNIDPSFSRLYAGEGIAFITKVVGTARECVSRVSRGELIPTSMPVGAPVVSGTTPDGMPSGPLSGPMSGPGAGGPGGMGGGGGPFGGASMPPGPMAGMGGGPFGGGGMPGGPMGGMPGGGPFGAGMAGGPFGGGMPGGPMGGMPGGAFGPGPLSGLVGGNTPMPGGAGGQAGPAGGPMGANPFGGGMGGGPFGGGMGGGPGLFYEMQERLKVLEGTVFELTRRLDSLEKK